MNSSKVLHKIRNPEIDPQTIGFDFDGVFADTMTLFIEIAKKEFGLNRIRYEDITSYTLQECLDIDDDTIFEIIEKLLSETYTKRLKPIQGAPEVLRRIGRHFGPLKIVTARPQSDFIDQWIIDVLDIEPSALDIVATGSFEGKAEILRDKKITVFVEDRLETCEQLQKEGIMPVIFKQPWNRANRDFIEVENWLQIETMLKFQD